MRVRIPGAKRIRSAVASARHAAGSGPCAASSAAAALVERPPQRRRARRHVARSAEPRVERARNPAAEHRAEVLLDVRPPAAGRARPRRVERRVVGDEPLELRTQLGVEHGREHGVREAAPQGVQHGGARRVDPAVEVGVEPAPSRGEPLVEAPRGRDRARRPRSAREHVAHHGPDPHEAEVLRRRTVHHADDARERVLRPAPDAGPEKVDPLHGAPRPPVVGGHAHRRSVVPVEDQPALRVDHLHVGVGREEPLPLVLAGPLRREPLVDGRRSHGHAAARVLRDVAAVGIDPVEGQLHPPRGADEVPRRADLVARELEEERQRRELAAPGGALDRDRDAPAVDGRVAGHRAVDRLVVDELPVGLAGPSGDRAGVDGRHRTALPAPEVGRVAAAAERLDVLVDDIGAGRRGAPREVDPASHQHRERDAGERDTARPVAAALEVELEEDCGIEVPDLRAGDEERLARRRAAPTDEERVRHREARRDRRRHGRRLVDDRVPDLADHRAETRRARDGDPRLRVVPLPQVLPDAPPLLLPEPTLERVQELRATHLVSAARAEDRADQRADRDDVVPRPAAQREPGGPVLRVDPRDVRVDDPDRS